ncbi:MAG: endolytic transglycosylase MltG, partial [Flavobacteriaceae bacterium]|nr:endolytic transglycosylase MltG [Flavobacteriaceae bacterium]
NLTHLERLCALANSTVLEVLFATETFVSSEVRAQIERGENPFAELRLRGNLTDSQLEQIGRVAELAAVTDNVEWLVNLIVEAGAVLAQIKRLDQYPKPGHYVLKHGMSNLALVEQLRSANEPIVLKFNNQERLEDLVGTLSRQIEPDSLELLMAFKNQEFLTKAQMNSETLLTLFVPNSYEVYWNVSAEGIGQRMLTEYRAFWNADRLEKAKAINLTPTQVVILASIVQKESVKPSERPIIAGVYLNRLRRNMPLQADPTVIFAKKKMENDYQQIIRRVLYKDLTLDSPYNTYKYAGLPPGPITMPDINSIDAVLNAERHQYLYFVADPNRPGFHDFSRSLSQHNRKRRAYINWIKKQGIKR